jgi:hypothetical protein
MRRLEDRLALANEDDAGDEYYVDCLGAKNCRVEI